MSYLSGNQLELIVRADRSFNMISVPVNDCQYTKVARKEGQVTGPGPQREFVYPSQVQGC